MRRRDATTALEDALHAGDSINIFISGASLAEYTSNRMLASAVERQFEILGEALGRALRADAAVSVRIPEVHDVIGFRNTLAHGYDIADDETVYENARTELPGLLEKLRGLLDEDERR